MLCSEQEPFCSRVQNKGDKGKKVGKRKESEARKEEGHEEESVFHS